MFHTVAADWYVRRLENRPSVKPLSATLRTGRRRNSIIEIPSEELDRPAPRILDDRRHVKHVL